MANFKNTPNKNYIIPIVLFLCLGGLLIWGLNKSVEPLTYEILVTGILTSLIASFTFLLFLFTLTPNLNIAKQIAQENDTYSIEVKNKSIFFSCNDLNVQLFILTDTGKEGKLKYLIKPLEINKSNISWIDSRSKKDDTYSYVLNFRLYGKIKEALQCESKYIMFRISGKHSFSGFTKTYTRYYKSEEELNNSLG